MSKKGTPFTAADKSRLVRKEMQDHGRIREGSLAQNVQRIVDKHAAAGESAASSQKPKA